MTRRGDGTISSETVATVSLVLLVTFVAPVVHQYGSVAGQPSGPLTVENATVETPVSIDRGKFGAETYHLSEITVRLDGLRGHGTLVVQIGIPQLDSFVLTRETEIGTTSRTDRTIRYQPSVEFHPDRITRETYLAQITVRLRSDGRSTTVAVQQTEIAVTN